MSLLTREDYPHLAAAGVLVLLLSGLVSYYTFANRPPKCENLGVTYTLEKQGWRKKWPGEDFYRYDFQAHNTGTERCSCKVQVELLDERGNYVSRELTNLMAFEPGEQILFSLRRIGGKRPLPESLDSSRFKITLR